MRDVIKFGSIGQFRNFIKTMQYLGWRKINLIGTVKIHGTNSSVGLDLKDNSLFYQSRNRVLSLDDDNYDFAKYIEDNKTEFLKIFDEIKNKTNTEKYDSIIIYGELAGKGIQNKVAVSQIDRFFAPFSIVGVNKDTVDELDVKLSINESIRFYPVETFGVYNVQLDLDNVHLAQQEIKDLTISVENECSVGKYFGVSGTGEGIVFTDETKQYSFKSKGEKHSVSKVKVIANVDIEKINKIKDFVDYSVTENRLNQGIEYLKEMNKELDISNMGYFLRWLANDVLKEEQDVITENSLDNDLKAIMKSVSSKGCKWFMDKINE
jgi:rnlB RNA ligase 2